MITLHAALLIAQKHDPSLKVATIHDVGECWVFSFVHKETNESPDDSPIYVKKSDGSTGVYFPPDHIEELKHAVEIDLFNELDDLAPYVIPLRNGDPIYDLCELIKYCKEKGVEPASLSDEERDQFIIAYHHNFTEDEIEFMKSIGLDLDFNHLTEDDWCAIEDTVGDKYNDDGFDDEYYYKINKIGLMCESILDKLND